MYQSDAVTERIRRCEKRLNDILIVANTLGCDKFSYKALIHTRFSSDHYADVDIEIQRRELDKSYRMGNRIDIRTRSHDYMKNEYNEHVVVDCTCFADEDVDSIGYLSMDTQLLREKGIESVTILNPMENPERLVYLESFLERVISKPVRAHAIGCIIQQLRHLFYTTTHLAMFSDKEKMPQYYWGNNWSAGRFPIAYRHEKFLIIPDINHILYLPIPHINTCRYVVVQNDPNDSWLVDGFQKEIMGTGFERKNESRTSSYIELDKPPFPDDRLNTPECLGVMLYLTNEYSGYTLVKSR